MTLTLQITSYQSQALGPDDRKVFTEAGGSVGRGGDCDWVLPDPERFVSAHHASVSFREGTYYLTDTSTNGVYLNDAATPLGKGKSVPLSNGDRLRFGDYEALVMIDQGPMVDLPGQQESMTVEEDGPAFFIGDGAGSVELAPSLDPLDFAAGSSGSRDTPSAPDSLDESADEPGAEADHVPPLRESFQPPDAHFEQIPEDWDKSAIIEVREQGTAEKAGGHEISPPKPSAAPKETIQPSAANADAVMAFFRGIGLDPEEVQEGSAAETMEKYGRLFRLVVEGMMEVLLARTILKSEFRMPLTTIRPVENNPLKFSPNIDEAVRNLFVGSGHGYLSAEEAIWAGFEDIKSHQMAMVAGMQAAFAKMMKRFNPEGFEHAEDAGTGGGALKLVNRKSRLWDAYADFYRNLADDPDSAFQQLFGDEFARAYEKQIERLSGLRQTPPR